MNLNLIGKTAVITGGTHGIGLEVAKSLAAEGCNVIVCSRTQKRISQTQIFLKEYKIKFLGVSFDATQLESIDEAIAKIKEVVYPDIIINNIGGGGRWGKEDILSTDFNVWQEVYNKNVNVAIKFTMAFLPNMIKKEWGRVIAVTSLYGKQGGGRPWFNVAKAAEMAFMKNLSLRKEFVRKGITFNSVAPGKIMIKDTGWETFASNHIVEYRKMLDESCPLGRLGTPNEIADMITFLCSDKAAFVNGACISVDGGESVSY